MKKKVVFLAIALFSFFSLAAQTTLTQNSIGYTLNTTDETAVVTVAQDVTYTANFALTRHTVTLAATNGSITGVTSGASYDYGTELTLTATPNEGYAFAGWSDGGQENPRTITVTQDMTLAATFAAIEYVDLGLPSGLLWATFNVGAAAPEEAGDYFAWGETQPKSNYTWNTYLWGYDDGSIHLYKYCYDATAGHEGYTDDLTTLDAADDAATVNWGGDWRMPTTTEQQELLSECTWTWTTINGMGGYEVKGTNGNSIFLPAAGYIQNTTTAQRVGSEGFYWSSTLAVTTSSPSRRAYGSYIKKTDGTGYKDYWRYSGHSVRPVQPKQSTITVTSNAGGTVTGGGVYDKGTTITLTATPDEGYVFAGWSDGNQENTRTLTVTKNDSFMATFVAMEYVDLGLTSGTLWATFNVGAAAPEQAGDYFSWGETQPKSNYTWNTYLWGYDDGSIHLYKYCYDATAGHEGYTDDLTTLEAADDAATANWGIAWRMPTTVQQQELLSECTWTWTTINGMGGYEVKGINGNSIFLPAAGYIQNTTTAQRVGSEGFYWSSTLAVTTSSPSRRAYGSYIKKTDGTGYKDYWRYSGHSVRPVQSPKYTITVTANEGGTATGGGEYYASATITLTATPNEGYVFTGWSDGSTDATRTITVTEDSALTASFAALQIVITEDTDLSDISGIILPTQTDILIKNGATLTCDEMATVKDVTVEAGGMLHAIAGGDLTVSTLILRSKDDVQPQVLTQGTGTITYGAFAFVKSIPADRYYFFSLPFTSNTSTVTINDETTGEAKSAVYNTDWNYLYYDGAAFAQTPSNESFWYTAAEGAMAANQGYAVGVDASSPEAYRELTFTASGTVDFSISGTRTVAVTENPLREGYAHPDKETFKGWNFILNPYTSNFTGTITLPGISDADVYVSIPKAGQNQTYTQCRLSDLTESGWGAIPPFYGFFVQVGKSGNVTFSPKAKSGAPRKTQAAQPYTAIGVTLSNGTEADITTLVIGEQYTDNYEIGSDLQKMIGYSTEPQVYLCNGSTKYAYKSVNATSAAKIQPMGVYLPAAGTYTFSLRDSETAAQTVYLYDYETNTTTNLVENDYTFTCGKLNSEKRFAISATLAKAPSITTSTVGTEEAMLEVWQDGALNVRIEGVQAGAAIRILNLQGQVVSQSTATDNSNICSVPQSGLYIVEATTTTGVHILKVTIY